MSACVHVGLLPPVISLASSGGTRTPVGGWGSTLSPPAPSPALAAEEEGEKRNNNDHQKREIRSKKNPPLKTCLSLSALWDRYRQNMHMDERVRGERKIRIWFLGKSTSETKVGRKEEAENCRELKINIETRRKKELRIELMRDAPMPLFLHKTTRVRVLAFAVLTEYLIRPLLMIE